MFINKKTTKVVEEILKDYLKPGDSAIDATVGNGKDTFLLASLVYPNGFVYGFDINKMAILNTQKMLDEANLSHVQLYLDSHSNIYKYNFQDIKLAVFNLGYLPRSDKKTYTTFLTTKDAIMQILPILKTEGMIIISSYRAHDESLEYQQLKEFLSTLPNHYLVTSIEFLNRPNLPPVIFIIEKK